MRVLISVDIEGIAGVVDWDDSVPGAPGYPEAAQLMTAEANAAVRGVLAHDADAEVLVADAHGYFRNISPAALHDGARLLRGRPRVDGMLAGVSDGVDAVLLIGYHGKAGTADAVLGHTMNGAVILDVRIDGRSLGEIGLNVAYAAAHGAPTVLVSGDASAAREAVEAASGIHTVVVKRALGGWAAGSVHPSVACTKIEDAVPGALADRARVAPRRLDGPVELEIDLLRPVMVEPLLLIPGVRRCGGRGLRYLAPDFPTAYRIVELVATLTAEAR